MNPLFDLTGRTALITGSSRGLGHAIASGYAAAGARVVINGTDAGRVAQAAQALRAQGRTVFEAPFDVVDEAQVRTAFEALDAQGVEVDVLVNNAGIQLRKPIVELQLDEWRKVLDTNLTSAFLVSREAARRMLARGKGGKIVNIGSLLSECGRATIAPYTAAKGGLKMLTRAMTAEWAAQGIQANAIGPGYMATEMNQALMSNPTFDAWVKDRTPAQRWGRPDELVGTAIYLASSASNFVNGQIIYVDGGFLAVL
ncbi:MAG: SDR family oxidoreductase [Rubrivivax sp.]|nr:SDR family oxidoreductase [Rubrivivax sp.]